jgi:phage terminase large subunit-like protein
VTPSKQLLAFAREIQLDLTPAQSEMATTFVDGVYDHAVWQCGRRGGKTLLADVLALYDVVYRDHLRQFLQPGELRVIAIVAQSLEKARKHIASCKRYIERSPHLAGMVDHETTDEIYFTNQAVLAAFPCSARSLRGDPCSTVILDELGHFITTEEGNAAGDSVYQAALPTLAQFAAQGWLIAISTPLWKKGRFYQLCKDALDGEAGTHFRKLTTTEMNPRIDPAWLEKQRRKDPDMFAREYLAEWVDGVSSYLESRDVLECQRKPGEPLVLAPVAGVAYYGALDPGFQVDAFGMAVGHNEGDRSIVDGVWRWRRYGFERTLDEVKAIAERYRISSLSTDQHAAVPVQEGLQRRGIGALYEPWTIESKNDAFSALKLGLNARQVELPRDPWLEEELLSLEARPTPAGYTRIAAAGSGHDDLAVAVAALIHRLRNATRGFNQAMGYFESHLVTDEQKRIADEYMARINAVDVDAYLAELEGNATAELAAAIRTTPNVTGGF